MMASTNIPNEVLTVILANLGFRDLKTARLVCRLWSILAVNRLFERIYVSCRRKDLEVFREISKHELCQRAVRKLIYDTSTARKVATKNKLYYSQDLIFQWGCLPSRSDGFSTSRLKAIKASTLATSQYYRKYITKFPDNLLAQELELKDEINKGYNAFRNWQDRSRKSGTADISFL